MPGQTQSATGSLNSDAQYIKRFEEYLRVSKGMANNSIAAYRTDIEQFAAFTAECRAGNGWKVVDHTRVREYLDDLRLRKYAASTLARKLVVIKVFFGYLKEEQAISINPTRSIMAPTIEQSPREVLTAEQVDLLLTRPLQSNTPKAIRDKVILELLATVGMLSSELVALNVDAVDLSGGNVSVSCPNPKGMERTILLTEHTSMAIRAYLEEARPRLVRQNESALFLNSRGQRLTRQGLWVVSKAKLPKGVTPRILRHSLAVRLLIDGVPVREVQQRLGHANVATTQQYIRSLYGFAP